MSGFPENVLLIGVDGGASEVRAHQILVLGDDRPPRIAFGPASASSCYELLSGFEPVPVAQQLLALERRRVEPSEKEELQGELLIEATARAILDVSAQAGERRVVIGMCMPGLKTADKRGIAVLKNGPRMPRFAEQLERELVTEGLELERPIVELHSDGEACAMGEECDTQGLLRDVENAYYLGAGTGLAEAFKLRGEIVGMDALKGTLPKAWQMESSLGAGFEELLSMRGINARYAKLAGRDEPQHEDEYPEHLAPEGDVHAQRALGDAAHALAELVFARLSAIHAGKKPGAQGPHPVAGTLLERVVVGQHLGRLFANHELATFLADRAEDHLARRIEQHGAPALRARYVEGGVLHRDVLVPSRLRSAPAIGAAALTLVAELADERDASTSARGPRAGASGGGASE